jgi:hypothetical protein
MGFNSAFKGLIGRAAANYTLQRLAGQSGDLVNVLLTAQNCKHGVPESVSFLLDVSVRPSFLPFFRLAARNFLKKERGTSVIISWEN